MVRKVLPDVVVNQDILMLPGSALVQDAAHGMAEKSVHAVLIVDGDRLTGIFTSTDLVRKVVAAGLKPSLTRLSDVMTSNPETIAPNFDAIEALHYMHDGHYRHLPVVENGKVVGILSRRDFLDYEVQELRHQEHLWEKM